MPIRCRRGWATLPVLVFLLSAFALAPSRAHNVTRLLANHPNFSTFNHYLTLTHLADDINARTTITVLAVDNDAMSDLLSSSHPNIDTLKNILSIHVLLDYFGARKIHQLADGSALAATLFQASGTAPGSTGFVNITDVKGGRVALGPEDNGGVLDAYYVRSLEEVPYNISVIQISKILPSAEAAAPAPDPGQMNLTALMATHGCREFADALAASPDAFKTYKDNVEGGLTVFCPSDGPFKAFRPKFNNLSAAGRVSFLEFYGIPIYMSMPMLRSNNGPSNTLATDGANKFAFTVQNDGQEVTLKTELNTVKISGTVIDRQPLAIYSTDGVLLPSELFKSSSASPAPAPAPAPEKPAPAPTPKVAKHGSPPAPASASSSPSDSPADSPDGDVADQTADNGAHRRGFGNDKSSLVFGLIVGAFLFW